MAVFVDPMTVAVVSSNPSSSIIYVLNIPKLFTSEKVNMIPIELAIVTIQPHPPSGTGFG